MNPAAKCRVNLSSKLEASPSLEDMEQYLLNDASLVKIEPEDLECILNEKTPPVSFFFFQFLKFEEV